MNGAKSDVALVVELANRALNLEAEKAEAVARRRFAEDTSSDLHAEVVGLKREISRLTQDLCDVTARARAAEEANPCRSRPGASVLTTWRWSSTTRTSGPRCGSSGPSGW